MSDSNRGDDTTVGLKRWLLPAIAFATVVLSYGVIQHGVHYYDASSYAAGHARDAQNQITKECRMPLVSQECADDIEQTRRENQRDEYDLYAQKAMALWTAIMGSMAVIGIALSGVGVYLIWRTWDATREAAENSRKTLSAYIAKERAILKAWQMNHCKFDEAPPLIHGFAPKFTNSGASPAHLVSMEWSYIKTGGWPEQFLHMKKLDGAIAAQADGLGDYLTADVEHPSGWIIAIKTSYMTVNDGPFHCHSAFRITYVADDGCTSEHWAADPTYIGQPFDT